MTKKGWGSKLLRSLTIKIALVSTEKQNPLTCLPLITHYMLLSSYTVAQWLLCFKCSLYLPSYAGFSYRGGGMNHRYICVGSKCLEGQQSKSHFFCFLRNLALCVFHPNFAAVLQNKCGLQCVIVDCTNVLQI